MYKERHTAWGSRFCQNKLSCLPSVKRRFGAVSHATESGSSFRNSENGYAAVRISSSRARVMPTKVWHNALTLQGKGARGKSGKKHHRKFQPFCAVQRHQTHRAGGVGLARRTFQVRFLPERKRVKKTGKICMVSGKLG